MEEEKEELCELEERLFSASEEEEEEVTERLDRIREAANAVLTGGMPVDEFMAFIKDQHERFSAHANATKKFVQETGYMETDKEEVEVGYEGITSYLEGFREMLRYGRNQDPQFLEMGLELMSRGNNLINKAKCINRDNRELLRMEFKM